MKKLVLLAGIILSGIFANAQIATWVPQATNFGPVSSGVFNISAVDQNVVWISSYDGSGGQADRQDYSRTIDGGNTWVANTVPVASNYAWAMIEALDANTAFALFYDAALGAKGQLWKTTDGGTTWNQLGATDLFTNAAAFANVVHFWDANEGLVMGDPFSGSFEIKRTTDGGATWTAVTTPANTTGEYGIVAHYDVKGDTMWFDTNKGRVFRSVDRGLTWTVSSTGIVVPATGAMDICFYNSLEGLARVYNGTTGVNTIKFTADGGDTWTTEPITGNLFGSDVKWVPGTASKLVSTGAATGFVGSSYSNDGGRTWVDIETAAQRTALGIVDSTTMWTGGFTTSPSSDGIYKYVIIQNIACGDTTISTGTPTSDVTEICPGDTVNFISTNVNAPTAGTYAGMSWVITTDDISNLAGDPTQDPSLVASYGITFPASGNNDRTFINDGSLIDGVALPYGIYYWTPVAFGNASGPAGSQFLTDLSLDPACVYVGASVMVTVNGPGMGNCPNTSINEVNASKLNVTTSMINSNTMNIRINAANAGKATVAIYDLTGRFVQGNNVMLNAGLNNEAMNVDALSTGTYIVRVALNGVQAVSKVVKY